MGRFLFNCFGVFCEFVRFGASQKHRFQLQLTAAALNSAARC